MTTKNITKEHKKPQQISDSKKSSSDEFQYKDYGLDRAGMKELLIKAAENLSWKPVNISSDKLDFKSESILGERNGEIVVLLKAKGFSVLCKEDEKEKNALNLKALEVELESIQEGKKGFFYHSKGKDILKEYDSKQRRDILFGIVGIIVVCCGIYSCVSKGCSFNIFSSKPSNCDAAIQKYAADFLPVCEAYKREKQKYRNWGTHRGFNTNDLAELEQTVSQMSFQINNAIERDFGKACMERFHQEVFVGNACW